MKNIRSCLKSGQALQVIGVPNAFSAIMAEQCGAKAIYLSGACVSNFYHGVTDTGIIGLDQVCAVAQVLVKAVDIPVIVDVDTGFESIEQTVSAMLMHGVSAIHVEDQVPSKKRCGHLDGKAVVGIETMQDMIRRANDARERHPDFTLIARTDALAVEGLAAAIHRAQKYVESGADIIFAEAFTDLSQYEQLSRALGDVPILANITEFGKTKLYSTEELSSVGVSMVLYPRSVERAMNQAASDVIDSILKQGSQQSCLSNMQTRDMAEKILRYSKMGW